MQAPHAHSIFFSTWFDFGLVGLLFMLWLTIYYARNLLPSLLAQRSRQQLVVSAMSGGLLVICLQGLVDFEYNTPSIWVYFALMTAALNLAAAEQKQHANP
jgi:O-antigen ligase